MNVAKTIGIGTLGALGVTLLYLHFWGVKLKG